MSFRALHGLLNSLTRKEKEAVDKVFSEKTTSKYSELYKYLSEHLGPFNEGRFRQFCQKRQLKDGTLRNYLKRLKVDVLDELRKVKAKEDAIFTLHQHLANARLLIQKEQFGLAKDELKKADKLESEVVCASARYEIEKLFTEILFHEDLKNIDLPLRQHLDKANKAVKEFQLEAQVSYIYHSLYRYGMRRKDQRPWQEFAADLAAIPFPDKADFITQFQYITAKIKIASWQKDFDLLLEWAQKGYDIFSAKPNYQKIYTRYFIAIIDHRLSGLSLSGRFEDMPQVLDELETMETDEPLHHAKQQSTLIYFRLTQWCNQPGPKTDISQLEIEKLKARYDVHYTGILPARCLVIDFLFSYLHFLRLEYGNAEFYFDKFEIHKSNNRRPDLLRIILVMQALVRADDDNPKVNFEDVKQLINRNAARLHAWNGLHRYETIAFRYCHKLNEARGMWAREKKELYQKFLLELKRTIDKETQRYEPGAEILMEWLKIKLAGSPDSIAA